MNKQVSPGILENWLKAWAISRELPLPVPYQSGFRIAVGNRYQKERYVFTEPNDDFYQLCHLISDPWIYLKVCAASDQFIKNIPGRWILQPQGYMMSCFRPMNIPAIKLTEGYMVEFAHYNSTFVVNILTESKEQAAAGRVVLAGDLAVYDRIVTEEQHRRKGLASFLIGELEKIALSKGVFNNFLVATEAGKSLYETLGWEVYSLYTSIVIPSKH
ncbi:MAG: GNAT family N-acetyltransferase [Chryseobacterium sp.]|uniref:GNAT family N-acetyltransferase n=1 Tax=Chryseobacterium sp. TaxID=1871047 RepID=UPI0025BE4EED|nr:GNAT family N-acetyltransferase [Chryseobacterium sp.]MCJ7932161.1 GNAT family N-acetyltransferase [Chryseobacterium sp.]